MNYHHTKRIPITTGAEIGRLVLPPLPFLGSDTTYRELEAGAETARDVGRALVDWLRAYATKVHDMTDIKPEITLDNCDDIATKIFDIHDELQAIAEKVGDR